MSLAAEYRLANRNLKKQVDQLRTMLSVERQAKKVCLRSLCQANLVVGHGTAAGEAEVGSPAAKNELQPC